MTIKILGVKINLNRKEEVLEEIKKYLILGNRKQAIGNRNEIKPFVIFTPNPEIINYAQKDPLFKQIVNCAQINIPDGAGLCFAIEKKFRLKTVRLSGTDLITDICNLSSKNSFTIGLIGGRGDVAIATRECLLRDYPNLRIEVLEGPEIIVSGIKYQVSSIRDKNIPDTKYIILNTEEKQAERTELYFKNLVKEIQDKKIDILFVALGFPKQEYFIARLARQFQISLPADAAYQTLQAGNFKFRIVLMSVGGAFDYISGRVKRAPLRMREKGLEWLYRLVNEPWRYKRQLAGVSFFWQAFFGHQDNQTS